MLSFPVPPQFCARPLLSFVNFTAIIINDRTVIRAVWQEINSACLILASAMLVLHCLNTPRYLLTAIPTFEGRRDALQKPCGANSSHMRHQNMPLAGSTSPSTRCQPHYSRIRMFDLSKLQDRKLQFKTRFFALAIRLSTRAHYIRHQ